MTQLITETDYKEQIKRYHLNRLQELSEKSLGEIPQLQEPSYEQKRWVLFRLSHRITWPKAYKYNARRVWK